MASLRPTTGNIKRIRDMGKFTEGLNGNVYFSCGLSPNAVVNGSKQLETKMYSTLKFMNDP